MESQTVEVKAPKGDMHERKAQLIREGEFYRVALVHAKAQVKHAARPDVLFHSAVDHATWAVRSRIDSVLKPTGASMATLAPILMTALATLPQKTQAIFRMHKFDGQSYAEVAAQLSISRSSVEKHMMDALRLLSARVQR